MTIQQFDENNHKSFLVDSLYGSRQQTADVHFLYEGPNNKDSTVIRIPAHRNVLAVNSTVFNELFYGPREVSGDIPTRSNTVTSQTFEAFISLLYGKNQRFLLFLPKCIGWFILFLPKFSGKCDSINEYNCEDLLRIAQNFQCCHLIVEACNVFIRNLKAIDSNIDR